MRRPQREGVGGWCAPSALSLMAVALFLVGCGGGSNAKTVTKVVTAPKKAPKRPTLVESVSVVPPEPAGQATPGDAVVFRTKLAHLRKNVSVPVHLDVQVGPANKLNVTASAIGMTATATLGSSTGKPLTLVKPRYSCFLPPLPTFCPIGQATSGRGHLRISITVRRSSSIELEATAGPLAKTPPVRARGTVTVAPFAVTEEVLAHPHGTPSSSATPGSTARVTPGDVVVMRTRLKGSSKGAPQKVTISFATGPAKTLTVAASVAGGATSKAVLKSANGGSITLTKVHYTCLLPPLLTFCPGTRSGSAAGQHSLTFAAAPSTPVTLTAIAQ